LQNKLVSTDPGRHCFVSVWEKFFLTRLGPSIAFALVVLFISYKLHFTSARKKIK